MTTADRVDGALQAITDGDWGALKDSLSDSFFGYTPGPGEPAAAKRLVELIAALKTAVPDLSVGVENLESEDDLLHGTLSLTGTHINPLWGSPGSGNAIAWTNPITFQLSHDGLAFRFDELAFPELIAVLRQFGMVNGPDEMDRPLAHPVVVPEFLLKLVMTGQAGDKECAHLDQIEVTEPTTRVCWQCVSEGTQWPALRMCLTCGFVGCCDTSKNKHMLSHHEESGHPMMRSIRMDEGWVWCYEDNAFFESQVLEGRPN